MQQLSRDLPDGVLSVTKQGAVAYIIAADAPSSEAPLASSIHWRALHGLQASYGADIDDHAILQPSHAL